MNQHKKAWLLFIILTLLFSCCSIAAFATEITPDQVQKIIDQQAAASKIAASNAAASAANSQSAASSKRSPSSRKTYSSYVSSQYSSGVLSETSSEEFSTISSEEASSEIVLPSVGSIAENNPLSSVIVDTNDNKKMKWRGILSWVCIALGVIVVLIVVFSNRRPPNGGSGRKRYRRPGRTNKKRLLNDKYYRNTKY